MSTDSSARIAAAPISWGVCEVPDWGYQLPRDRVLAEMRDLQLGATELGPDGFLPTDPASLGTLLGKYDLVPVGGFVPIVMHEPGHDPLPAADELLSLYVEAGAGVLVMSAASGRTGYDDRPALDGDGWSALLRNLDRVTARAAEHNILAVLHPHVGTMVENGYEVQRVLEGSSVSLCLDTGHLMIGGVDPAELTRQAPERIAHVHLKDVDSTIASRVQSGRLSYSEGVKAGMYRSLGTGDVDIMAIVRYLQGHDYAGWYTLEQDTVLTEPPRLGDGPIADVRDSAGFIRRLLFGEPPPPD